MEGVSVWGVDLAVVVLMIAINSIFAAYELALASVGLARLDTLAREKRHGAAAALRMKGRMEASLAVVQLGITLVGVIAAATGGSGAEEKIEPVFRAWGMSNGLAQVVALATIVIPLTVVTIIFGELVPKVFALRNTEWVCLQLSPFMEWFALLVRPAVWLLEKSVQVVMDWSQKWRSKPDDAPPSAALQELQAIAALARTSRLIGARQEGIIVNAARLSHTPVRAIMLPAGDISMLHASDSMDECLIAAHHDLHTRFPVSEQRDDPQTIVGYANFKDIIAAMRLSPRDSSLRGILRPLISFRSDQSVAACLEQMIHTRNHIALVKSPSGETLGMITMEDILEEMLGEIHDEFDRLPAHISRSGTGWIVGGHATLDAVRKVADLDLKPLHPDRIQLTVTDWVSERLGGPVEGGEVLNADDLRVVVRKVRRQRVYEAQITRVPPAQAAGRPQEDAPTV